QDRLRETAEACRGRGAETGEIVVDVRERAAVAQHLVEIDSRSPVDLVIANAGVSLPNSLNPAEDHSVHEEIDINLVGALNTALPLAPAMAARRHGQIALMSSLAAFAPQPSSPGYSATKAALLSYGLAFRERLRPTGVKVNVICPGFIDTGMGARYRGWRPLA